jgi:SNF2 family DNA or RNA helicase
MSVYRHKRRAEDAKIPRRLSLAEDMDMIRIEFPYNPELVSAVKKLPSRVFGKQFDPNDKNWYAKPIQSNVEGLRDLYRHYGFEVTDAAAERLRKAQSQAIGTITLTDDGFAVSMTDTDWNIVGELKNLRQTVGGKYDHQTKTNTITDCPEAGAPFREFLNRHGKKFTIDPKVGPRLDLLIEEGKEKAEKQEARRDASRLVHGEYEVEGLAVDPYPFQQVGIEYVAELTDGRTMIADEQGLGKTLQAIGSLQARDSFPAVIVCPSHLKENWAREFAKVLPGKIIQMITGRKSVTLAADVHIINYEILSYHIEDIRRLDPKGLVFDESHKVKNRDSKRTKAAKEIADNMREGATVLLLTGTPMPNRPFDLISQLDILGKLDDFGGFKGFVTKYIGWRNTGYGYDFSGAIKSNMPDLNQRLRESCYVRRIKKDVLPELPPVQRSVVPMKIKNRGEYNRARGDLRKYLRKHGTSMTEVNSFRQLTARLKIDSVIEWVETFLESDEKLIVFAHHKASQEALVAAFPDAAQIRAKDVQSVEERVAAEDRFQNDPDCKLVICSLEVAQTGLTLTAASNVAFVELGWTPDVHEQAEARSYGRINDAHGINAYYLLAENTVDEHLSKLIEKKRKITMAAADGHDVEDFDIESALMDWLKSDDEES